MSKYKEHFYKLMVLIGLLIWIAETAYFGWHEKAQSSPERLLDALSVLLILWGVLGDIATNLNITKVTNINTDKNVVVQQDPKEKS